MASLGSHTRFSKCQDRAGVEREVYRGAGTGSLEIPHILLMSIGFILRLRKASNEAYHSPNR